MSIRDIKTVRAWEPGDGVTCDSRARAATDVPCGPPVVTAVFDGGRNTYREHRFAGNVYGMAGQVVLDKRKVYCASHIPTGMQPGQMRAAAKKAALEELAVENWGTYNRLVKEHLAKKIADQLDFLPEAVRADVVKLMNEEAAPECEVQS